MVGSSAHHATAAMRRHPPLTYVQLPENRRWLDSLPTVDLQQLCITKFVTKWGFLGLVIAAQCDNVPCAQGRLPNGSSLGPQELP
jgi:hypothetical protein